MNLQDLEKLIKGRRSVRQWKKQDVPEEMLEKAVELRHGLRMEVTIRDGVSSS